MLSSPPPLVQYQRLESNQWLAEVLPQIASGTLEPTLPKRERAAFFSLRIFAVGASVAAAIPFIYAAEHATEIPLLNQFLKYGTLASLAANHIYPYLTIIQNIQSKRAIKRLLKEEIVINSYKIRELLSLLFGAAAQIPCALILYASKRSALLVPLAFVGAPIKAHSLQRSYSKLLESDGVLTKIFYRNRPEITQMMAARECLNRLLSALSIDILSQPKDLDSKVPIIQKLLDLTTRLKASKIKNLDFLRELIFLAAICRENHLGARPPCSNCGENSLKSVGSLFATTKTVLEAVIIAEGGRLVIDNYCATIPIAIIATLPTLWPTNRYLRKVGSTVYSTLAGTPGSKGLLLRKSCSSQIADFSSKIFLTAVGALGVGYIMDACNKWMRYQDSARATISIPATLATALINIYILFQGSNALITSLSRSADSKTRMTLNSRIQALQTACNMTSDKQFKELFGEELIAALADGDLHQPIQKGESPRASSPLADQQETGFVALPGAPPYSRSPSSSGSLGD